jgi:hypothetical protein
MKLFDETKLQTGGDMHAWRSPDSNFRRVFLKLDLSCEPVNRSGVVIIADEHCDSASIAAVENLRRELPGLLSAVAEPYVVYWSTQLKKEDASKIIAGLTEHPQFDDHLSAPPPA